jgi:hypothetical protein
LTRAQVLISKQPFYTCDSEVYKGLGLEDGLFLVEQADSPGVFGIAAKSEVLTAQGHQQTSILAFDLLSQGLEPPLLFQDLGLDASDVRLQLTQSVFVLVVSWMLGLESLCLAGLRLASALPLRRKGLFVLAFLGVGHPVRELEELGELLFAGLAELGGVPQDLFQARGPDGVEEPIPHD